MFTQAHCVFMSKAGRPKPKIHAIGSGLAWDFFNALGLIGA